LIDAATEEQVAGRELSPRDSGFEGAGSSLKFDSRPSSGTAIIPKLETDEVECIFFCYLFCFSRKCYGLVYNLKRRELLFSHV